MIKCIEINVNKEHIKIHMNDRYYLDSNITELSNGLKVVTIKRNTKIISIEAGIKAGAFYESQNEKGLSHLIEHMIFKGTEKRTNVELNRDLEFLGGDYNAYTDYDSTVFDITALKEEAENAFEILSDMLMHADFPKNELKKEKQVVLAEIKSIKDDVESYTLRKVNSIAFKKSALKIDVLGKAGAIRKYTRENVLSYYKNFYVPNNCCIVIVSEFDHDDILKIVKKYFEEWKKKDIKKREIIIEKNIPVKKKTYKAGIELSTICYLFTFHGLNKRQELILKLLNHKLGVSSNSILFRKIREEYGLAYDVYSDIDLGKYTKSLYIYIASSQKNIPDVIYMLDECLTGIKEGKIKFNKDVICLMEKMMKTSIVEMLEDPYDLSDYALHKVLDNENINDYINNLNMISDITEEDIREVSNIVFNDPTIHILVPKFRKEE